MIEIIGWIGILFVVGACYMDQLGFIRKINSLEQRLDELESNIEVLLP